MSETKLLRNLDMKTFKSITLLLASFSFGFADDHSNEAPVESDYYPITTIPLPEGEVIEVSGIDIISAPKNVDFFATSETTTTTKAVIINLTK